MTGVRWQHFKWDVFLGQDLFRCLSSELCWLTSPCHRCLSTHVNEAGGNGTKGWFGFHLVWASLRPLPPEHYISRCQRPSGSENNGRETGNMPFHPHLTHRITFDTFWYTSTGKLINWEWMLVREFGLSSLKVCCLNFPDYANQNTQVVYGCIAAVCT